MQASKIAKAILKNKSKEMMTQFLSKSGKIKFLFFKSIFHNKRSDSSNNVCCLQSKPSLFKTSLTFKKKPTNKV